MAEHQFSKACAFAHQHHKGICMELARAGFDLIDNELLRHSAAITDPHAESPGMWAVHFQPDDDGHQMLVFSIHGNDDEPYGISYAVTLCGQPRGVNYWSGWEATTITGGDREWPGLSAAVLKGGVPRSGVNPEEQHRRSRC